MVFKNTSESGTGLMERLAAHTGSEFKNGLIVLPESFGKGYIKYYDLGPSLKMMVNQSILHEDMNLKRANPQQGKNEVTFSFRNVFAQQYSGLLPSVQVSSSNIDLEVFIPAGTPIHTILITVHTDLLKDLLNHKKENSLLQNILFGDQLYFYEEVISPEIQDIAANIAAVTAAATATVSEELSDFYMKLKAQEMIYLFFVELLKREQVTSFPFNVSDVKAMYLIRDQIAADLSISPNLPALTSLSNMSESKMSRLFRQIFGSSIYHYYQNLRMNKAAYMIKEEKLSVSETGYRLGFTNLSHFTRIFEKHMGLKPKKYSISSLT